MRMAPDTRTYWGVHFGLIFAYRHRQLWVVLCPSWLRSMLVESDSIGGQIERNKRSSGVQFRIGATA